MEIPENVFAGVIVNFRFVGYHNWPGAPAQVAYLKRTHRHEFHVKAGRLLTQHTNREIEFIQLKQQMLAYVRASYEEQEFEYSCEDIALDLLHTFNLDFCNVLEDGENGAWVQQKRSYKEGNKT